jgi:lipoprotein-releasing system permease protein
MPSNASKSKFDISYFIASRLSNAKQGSTFSVLITNIAVGSIALGLATMIISFLIFEGFQTEIREKIFSFTAHIQVSKFDANNSYQTAPLSTQREFLTTLKQMPEIGHIQQFSQKPALLKTEDEIMGALIKGVAHDFDTARFSKNLIAGSNIAFNDSTHSNDLIISKKFVDKLKLRINDTIIAYFFQDPPRFRKMNIKGIYETGLEDFDDKIVLADNRLIQRLNNWSDTLTGGFEIFLKDFNQLNDPLIEKVYENLDYDISMDVVTVQYGHLFEWFEMLNRNVVIFLSVILVVACFNVVSILLILIMERTNMIGSLKAFGATNALIKKVFFYHGIHIIIKGVLIGNTLGLSLGYLQYRFRLIPLDPENYYINTVPIAWDWVSIVGVNVLLLVVIGLVLWIPTSIISRITPIKAIRFS